jgi:arsenate reductase (thioredoxin)
MNASKGKTILFICTGNSCRSQMAEGFARKILPKSWRVFSAGTIAAGIHPLTIEAMKEAGVDISAQHSKAIGEIPMKEVDHVVTLCSDAHERCPVFPNARSKEHWPVEDPNSATNGPDAMAAFRRVRDEICQRVEELADRLGS